jgi:hypothetical protein
VTTTMTIDAQRVRDALAYFGQLDVPFLLQGLDDGTVVAQMLLAELADGRVWTQFPEPVGTCQGLCASARMSSELAAELALPTEPGQDAPEQLDIAGRAVDARRGRLENMEKSPSKTFQVDPRTGVAAFAYPSKDRNLYMLEPTRPGRSSSLAALAAAMFGAEASPIGELQGESYMSSQQLARLEAAGCPPDELLVKKLLIEAGDDTPVPFERGLASDCPLGPLGPSTDVQADSEPEPLGGEPWTGVQADKEPETKELAADAPAPKAETKAPFKPAPMPAVTKATETRPAPFVAPAPPTLARLPRMSPVEAQPQVREVAPLGAPVAPAKEAPPTRPASPLPTLPVDGERLPDESLSDLVLAASESMAESMDEVERAIRDAIRAAAREAWRMGYEHGLSKAPRTDVSGALSSLRAALEALTGNNGKGL